MSEFEKLYGEVLLTPEESAEVTIEEVVAALTEVALEVKEGEEVFIQDPAGNIFRKQQDGKFHLNPKRDYVIMRRSVKDLEELVKRKEEADKKEAALKAKAATVVTSFAKRDKLRAIELEMQAFWEAEKIFELDAPTSAEGRLEPKFLATFPYPYMNGRLHLGHTFTLAKSEFAVGYERLKGKRAIFPFGFHCTGMPIKAAADKLAYEMETFGNPPQFPVIPEALDIRIFAHDPEKKKKKGAARKSKVASKASAGKYQWQIMKNSDVPEDQIPAFAKGEHWIKYFPPLAIQDLKLMGAKIDWRRSFVTTDHNPFYDSFVRWQFNRLKASGKVLFGKRNTIYSPKDKGACMDHERASGEGITPTEYTIVKQRLLEPYPKALEPLAKLGKPVFLIPATLRPETMYGQTNCWVLPTGEYGAFEVPSGEIFVCTARAARNFAFQGEDDKAATWGVVKQVLTFTGQDLVGAALKAPLTPHEKIYVLPMLSVLTTKGTGVVTSVPSDSPDDYTAFRELKNKPDFRKKFGVTDEMVLPFEVINIINIPGLGDCAAQTVVDAMKIKSPNDRALLDKAKEEVYQKGFYEGSLIVGPYKGRKVEEVKAIIKGELVAAGLALNYAEPGGEVISRSGDECVVALIDQWYLDYGEKAWLELAKQCAAHLNTYGPESRQLMDIGLSWMNKWACSRSFGLGTRLPWDETFLIESLSDSTIYMAYYTICHLLHKDLYGHELGEANIPAAQMTDAVWDYILQGKALPEGATTIPQATLDKLRGEFTYWYPVDLRVSGKDLINNHLLFWIYNHVALFEEKFWPQGYRLNGHVLLNKMKMAKSTGNFITLQQGVERFSADGMRFALADAGDGVTDANFTTETADGALLKLYTQIEWIEEMLALLPTMRKGEFNFMDQVFASQIAQAIELTDKAFGNMEYKEGVKVGYFDLQTAKDTYQDVCKLQGTDTHADLIMRFIRAQVLLLTPICPHWSDYIWMRLLKEPKSVMHARWPVSETPVDPLKLKQQTYLDVVVHDWRVRMDSHMKPKKGPAQPAPKNMLVVVARQYPAWQATAIRVTEKLYRANNNTFPEQAALLEALRAEKLADKDLKNAMAHSRAMAAEHVTAGDSVFALTHAWDELALLKETSTYISRSMNIPEVIIAYCDDARVSDDKRTTSVPGKPAVYFNA